MKIKINKYLVSKLVLIFAFVFAICILFCMLSGITNFIMKGKEFRRKQVLILCETDHQVLLETCRELSRQITKGDLKPGRYKIRKDPNPESNRFPQLILDLEPKYIVINADGQVKVAIEELGAFAYFGIRAYPEEYKESKSGDIELVDGLWYYDDQYNNKYPKYKKKVDELIQKGKMRQIEKNAAIVSDVNNSP